MDSEWVIVIFINPCITHPSSKKYLHAVLYMFFIAVQETSIDDDNFIDTWTKISK